jgi:plastocyanin
MIAFDVRRARWTSTVAIGAAALMLVWLFGDASADGVAQASRAKTVNISGFAFHPSKITVSAGTRVAFSNSDGAPHTATRAGSFNTGTVKPGTTVAIRFSRKGTFGYHCAIHPSMHGKVVVR